MMKVSGQLENFVGHRENKYNRIPEHLIRSKIIPTFIALRYSNFIL